jgi:hypothetical protein
VEIEQNLDQVVLHHELNSSVEVENSVRLEKNFDYSTIELKHLSIQIRVQVLQWQVYQAEAKCTEHLLLAKYTLFYTLL